MAKKSMMDDFEIISSLYLVILFIFIAVTAYVGDHTLFLVMIGFSPTILTVIISLLIHEQAKHHKHVLWIVPLLIMAGFFALKDSPLFIDMDIEVLTAVNFLLSMIYVILAFAVYGKEEEEAVIEAVEDFLVTPISEEKSEKELTDYINSIEDKSKALNFAIGRVYSQFHGGSKKLREKIQIPSDWYNEFSLVGIAKGKIDKEKLLQLITKFELQLKSLEKSEYEVFNDEVNKLKNLIREPHGKDKIIDVLDYNEKDPVRSYYEGAMEFCQRIREEIDKMEVNVVKSGYVPKTKEEAVELDKQIKAKVVSDKKDTENSVKKKEPNKPKFEGHP
jgi:transcription antitermination factor NusA-like protein